MYMGWPSPLVMPHAGRELRRSRHGSVPLDEHGWVLGTAFMAGNDWGQQHDAVAHVVFTDSTAAGMRGDREPRGVFADVIPPHILDGAEEEEDEMEVRYGRGRLQRRRWRRRHSIIPDMRIQRRGRDGVGAPMPVLMDFKGLHYSATTYTDAALRPRGLFRGRRVTRPVERRQAAVAGEYKSRARQLDRQLHGLTAARQNAGERGPVETALDRYPIEGLVFGTFNEWSSAMHAHARAVAAEASISCWRQLGAATLVEAPTDLD